MTPREQILIGAFWFVVGLGLIMSTCCRPPEVEVRRGDNLSCRLRGYEETVLTGYTELPVTMGSCDCTGIPVALECVKTST